jgi:glycosyltransferase involved in cell wall biosynthesis
MNVKVSVILIAYNGQSYIREQISSIIKQLKIDDELIISDDSSNDNTPDIIQSFDDPRIIFTQNSKRLGIVKNFEKAAMLAQGDIVFFSDQDDIWLTSKVETSLNYLQKYDLVVSNCLVWDYPNDKIVGNYFDMFPSKRRLIEAFFMTGNFLGCCIACRREVLEFALPFPSTVEGHDTWIGLVAQMFFTIHHIPTPFVLYRRHATNSSFMAPSPRPISAKILTRLKTWCAMPTIFYRYYFKKNFKNG